MSLTFEDARDLIESSPSCRSRGSRKLRNNTYLERLRDNLYAVRLHNTYVVYIHEDGTYTLNSGGWYTNTTMDRMRDVLPYSIRLWSSSGRGRGQRGWRIVGVCPKCRGRTRCEACWGRKKPCTRCNGKRALDTTQMGLAAAFMDHSGGRAWKKKERWRNSNPTILAPKTKVRDKEEAQGWVYCDHCQGTGKEPDHACPRCGGSGRTTPPCEACGSEGPTIWEVPFFDGIKVDGRTGEVLNADQGDGRGGGKTFSGWHGGGWGPRSLNIPECKAWFEDVHLIAEQVDSKTFVLTFDRTEVDPEAIATALNAFDECYFDITFYAPNLMGSTQTVRGILKYADSHEDVVVVDVDETGDGSSLHQGNEIHIPLDDVLQARFL